MSARLQIITDALINTGNRSPNVEYDGSPEWQVADSAYRRSLNFLIPRHTWKFASTTAPLAGLLITSPHPRLDKAYALPGDCLLVEGAWLNGRGLSEYEIIDQKFCCRFDSGVTVKYVRAPIIDQWPKHFVELLTMKVEEYLLRGLNEDIPAADRRKKQVDDDLDEIRSSIDRQQPPAARFRSRSALRRMGGGSLTLSRMGGPPNDSVS